MSQFAESAGKILDKGASSLNMAVPSQILWMKIVPQPGFDFEGDTSMSVPSRRSRLEVEDNGEIAVVNFIDRKILDEQNIQKIGEDLFSLIDQYDRKKILLNFRNVEYLSSAALGKFITLNKKVQSKNGKLVMCNINEDIFEVFEITRLDRLFNIQKDEQSALQTF